MAVSVNTYGGLRGAVLAWSAREGDTRIDSRFDDFLLNFERRMYYGFATEAPDNPLHSEPLRIIEMETVDPAFALYDVVPQPEGFLELISAQLNDPNMPMQIVTQGAIDRYGTMTPNNPRLIAVSGENFRVFPADPAPDTDTEADNPYLIWYLGHWQIFDPSTGQILTFVQTIDEGGGPGSDALPAGPPSTATLRYYRMLTTPSGSETNAILTRYPDLYLYGCLTEASIFSQDRDAALNYLQMYNASVSGLNARTQRITASARPVMRLPAGMMTP